MDLFHCGPPVVKQWPNSGGFMGSDPAIHKLQGIAVRGIPTPLKNMSSSVGMMKFPIYGKIKTVPNHQPVLLLGNLFR